MIYNNYSRFQGFHHFHYTLLEKTGVVHLHFLQEKMVLHLHLHLHLHHLQ